MVLVISMGKRKHEKEEPTEEDETGATETVATGKRSPHKALKLEPMKEEVEMAAKMDTSLVNSEESRSYDELIALVSVIAKPLASRKLTKKLYKAVKKAQRVKRLKRGVREVVKGLRKNEKGVVVLAGDVSPIDVISHIPVFCEEKGVPYCYVPSRKDLGAAGGTKRPTSVVLIQSNNQYKELYDECYSKVDSLPLPI